MANEIVKSTEAVIRAALYGTETLAQFESILGKSSARHYVSSVFLAVANSPELQECHPESIIRSALRCAAFELSCDPAAKQGQLVPFWNSKKGRKDAQLIIHYKGLSLLAQRSGLYRHCNVSEVYKGYEVEKDIMTGIHAVKFNKDEFNANVVIGYLGYFETKSGFKKTVYWTIEEITAHAAKFAPRNPLYKPGNSHYKTMLEKTVWRDLMSWADMGGVNNSVQIEAALEDVEDGEYIEPEEIETVRQSEAQNLKDLGFEVDEPAQIETEPELRGEEVNIQPEKTNPDRPYAAETLRKKIESSAATYAMDKATVSDPQRKIMAAAIDGIFGDKLPTRRYELCLYLTGKSSTKDIPAEYVLAVLKWLGNGKADHVGFEYQADEITRKEAHAAHEAALLAKGQTALLPE